MTPLQKPVHRVTRGAYRVLYSQPRQIVVTLAPGDLIEFREHGRRQRWALPVDSAFRQAVHNAAQQAEREKKARRGCYDLMLQRAREIAREIARRKSK